ncbi:MAG: transglycosylase SLT domain-containing protein [Blastocatellia bacterium]
MRLGEWGRCGLGVLLSVAVIPAVAPAQSNPQQQEKPAQNSASSVPVSISPVSAAAPAPASHSSSSSEEIISKAETAYHLGDEAFAKGQTDQARRLFDESVDAILLSGADVQHNSALDSYYHKLIDRIHSHEALPGDDHTEKTAPSLLDELSNLKESDLATATTNGVKIYGKYDFDFSVAQPALDFLNYFVAGRGRSTMEVGLQRSGQYRAMVEKIFKEEHVPLDLIWLAQAESVWKPNALSRAAAKGLWQFIPGTGSRYGLNQTTWVDDRSQPEKSTRAAARYLKWLHDHFAGDWLLAMAAYNAGENRVDEAVARCGYADFWELHRRNLLPQETRNYVPIILAIMIVSKNQKRYGFDVTPSQPVQYDSFQVPSQTDLKVVADLCGVTYDTVQDLNPELRRGTTPPDEAYMIRIPKGTRKAFEEAYTKLPEDQRVRKIVIARDDFEGYRGSYRMKLVAYHARSGDTLSALARKYKVPVNEIAKANRMSTRGSLRKGQTIKIPTKVAERGRHGRGRYREERVGRSRYGRGGRTSRSSRRSGGSSHHHHRR